MILESRKRKHLIAFCGEFDLEEYRLCGDDDDDDAFYVCALSERV
jgi:hypothetical protein